MSLFAVWFFVRIYCPMSSSISIFLSEFFLPLLVWFLSYFLSEFVRCLIRFLCPTILSDSLSDFLFDFFARYFVRCIVRFCFQLFCPTISSEFICPIFGWVCRLIFCPNLLSDVLFDLFVWFFVRLSLSIFCANFFVRLLCSILFLSNFLFHSLPNILCDLFFRCLSLWYAHNFSFSCK